MNTGASSEGPWVNRANRGQNILQNMFAYWIISTVVSALLAVQTVDGW